MLHYITQNLPRFRPLLSTSFLFDNSCLVFLLSSLTYHFISIHFLSGGSILNRTGETTRTIISGTMTMRTWRGVSQISHHYYHHYHHNYCRHHHYHHHNHRHDYHHHHHHHRYHHHIFFSPLNCAMRNLFVVHIELFERCNSILHHLNC